MCVHAKLLQSCLTLCFPMDCSPPGSSSMGFSRQEYWRGWPFPLPGDLPDPGSEPGALALAGGLQRMRNNKGITVIEASVA